MTTTPKTLRGVIAAQNFTDSFPGPSRSWGSVEGLYIGIRSLDVEKVEAELTAPLHAQIAALQRQVAAADAGEPEEDEETLETLRQSIGESFDSVDTRMAALREDVDTVTSLVYGHLSMDRPTSKPVTDQMVEAFEKGFGNSPYMGERAVYAGLEAALRSQS